MARIFLRVGEGAFKYVGPSSVPSEIFGTAGVETVYVSPDGNGRFDPSFNRGGDQIFFEDNATKASSLDYYGQRVGSNLVLTSQIFVGASISIPIGSIATNLIFSNGSFQLISDANGVRLGAQVITTTSERLDDVGTGAPPPAAALSFEETSSADAVSLNALALPKVDEIFGTAGHETIQLTADAKVIFDPSFNRGGDEIILAGNAEGYAAVRSGSSLVLTNDAGASITIPVGGTGTTLTFDGGSFVLIASEGGIKLGDHVVTAVASALDDPSQTLDQLLSAALTHAGDTGAADVPALPDLSLDTGLLDQTVASSQSLLG